MVPFFGIFYNNFTPNVFLDNHPNVIFSSYNCKIVDIIMAIGVKQLFQNLKSYIFE
jgi:hypothetical protein